VRIEAGVGGLAQRTVRRQGLFGEDVEERPGEFPLRQCAGESLFIDRVAAAEVVDERRRRQQRKAPAIEQAVRLRIRGQDAQQMVGRRERRVEFGEGYDTVALVEPGGPVARGVLR